MSDNIVPGPWDDIIDAMKDPEGPPRDHAPRLTLEELAIFLSGAFQDIHARLDRIESRVGGVPRIGGRDWIREANLENRIDSHHRQIETRLRAIEIKLNHRTQTHGALYLMEILSRLQGPYTYGKTRPKPEPPQLTVVPSPDEPTP